MKLVIRVCVALSLLCFVQCDKTSEVDMFAISKGKVGALSRTTKISALDSIFAKDSIVKNLSEGAKGNGLRMSDEDQYLIYEKGGKHLLTIVPQISLDSTSLIKSIQVFDKRFKTKKGVSIGAPYRDVFASQNLSSEDIDVSFFSISIFLKSLNADITLDKEEAGVKNFNEKVSPEQIPDLVKVKTLVLWLNQ